MEAKFSTVQELKDLIEKIDHWLKNKGEKVDDSWLQSFHESIEKKYKKYPNVLRQISTQDVRELEGLNAENIIPKTPLEKVLMAIVWKQGDYIKVPTFIKALNKKEKQSEIKTGLVFHQFARHVSDFNKPIVDQHVLRAYLALKHFENEVKLVEIRRKGAVTNKDTGLIAEYINWYQKQKLSSTTKYLLDDYLFVLGKLIKLK